MLTINIYKGSILKIFLSFFVECIEMLKIYVIINHNLEETYEKSIFSSKRHTYARESIYR